MSRSLFLFRMILTQKIYEKMCRIYAYILPHEREKEKMTERTNEVLVKLFQDATDHRERMDYLKELYQDNYLFILKVCRKFSAFEEIDDLTQEAFLGLRIAVERYDPDQGVPFVNYAAIWIEQALRRYLEN